MRILVLTILGAGFFLPLSVYAGDLAAGKAKVEKSCAVCHGLDGQATVPLAAHISGQQKDYMIIQLRAYRSGKRHHEQMSIIAKPLTNEDIDDVSEWYSNIKVKIEVPELLDTKEDPSDSSSNTKTENVAEMTTDKESNANKKDVSNVSDGSNDDQLIEIDPEVIKLIQDSIEALSNKN